MAADTAIPVAALPFDIRPGEVERNLAAATAGLEAAADRGARLLALPEKWTTSFLPAFSVEVRQASDRALATLHARAAELGVVVVGSAPGGEGEKPHNELHILGAAGDLRPYRKRVLFSPTGEGRQNARGDGAPATVETPLGRVAGIVCYDLRFPELTRRPFYDGADLMVVVAQWPHPRTSILEVLGRARAAENQCWLLACNRAGAAGVGEGRRLEFPGTAFLSDPLGEVVARVDDGSLLMAAIDPAFTAEVRKRVPCARDARLAGLAPD